ncbi:MAG TPA: hypothetical protein EYQ07_03220 [Candidatus Poseidoniales archaeon]|nr:hypothetical protein [Candidatus Poseidoniales archaeon]
MIEILSLPIEEPIYVGTCIGVGMVTVSFCFLIHLLATLNEYHRPILPILASLIFLFGPALMLGAIDGQNQETGRMYLFELDYFKSLLFLLLDFGFSTLFMFMPLLFAAGTVQMLRITFARSAEDPLLASLDD